jgi:hypothetical protein
MELMRHEGWRAVVLGIGLALAGREAALAQPAPARALLFNEEIDQTPGSVATLGTATLRKGKPNRILRVDVKLAVNPLVSGDSLGLVNSILVNGHTFFSSVPGQPGGAELCSEGIGGCSAGGTAWVDLDEAEAAFPGEFRGQPLEIEVQGRAETDAFISSIRLQILGELLKK